MSTKADLQDVKEAIHWISNSMVPAGKPHVSFSAFEVNIRILGGLLSAVHIGGGKPMFGGQEQALLKRATEVGVRLLSAFQTTSGVPFKDVDLQLLKGQQPEWARFTSVADSCTWSMEFSSLSRVRIHSHTLLIHHTLVWHLVTPWCGTLSHLDVAPHAPHMPCACPAFSKSAGADNTAILAAWLASLLSQCETITPAIAALMRAVS
jgi:hypothetical protein